MSDSNPSQTTRAYVAGLADAKPILQPNGVQAPLALKFATKQDADGKLIPVTIGMMDELLDADLMALGQRLEDTADALAQLYTAAEATLAGITTLNGTLATGNALQTARNGMATGTNQRLDTLHSDNGTINASVQAVTAALGGTLKVSGTFWQPTQPVSAVSLPLPSGASTETTLAAVLAAIKATNGGGTPYTASATTPTTTTVVPAASNTTGLRLTALTAQCLLYITGVLTGTPTGTLFYAPTPTTTGTAKVTVRPFIVAIGGVLSIALDVNVPAGNGVFVSNTIGQIAVTVDARAL